MSNLIKPSWMFKSRHHSWQLSASLIPLQLSSSNSVYHFNANITLTASVSGEDSPVVKKLLQEIEGIGHRTLADESIDTAVNGLKDIDISRSVYDSR